MERARHEGPAQHAAQRKSLSGLQPVLHAVRLPSKILQIKGLASVKYRLLQFLICPCCGEPPQLTVTHEQTLDCPAWTPAQKCSPCALAIHDPASGERCQECSKRDIIAGKLTCACGCVFPIVDGVPVLIPGQEARGSDNGAHVHERSRKTSQRFGYEWARYPACFYDEELKIFFAETQLAPRDLNGNLVLDAGCGMGRFTRVAGTHGGEIIGVDVSESVYKADALTRDLANVHIIRGDLLQLPFRDAAFDIVYSLGVLHHTPSTKKSFEAVAGKLKKGGLLSIWVYGAAGRYANFKTNPLRAERSRYLRSGFTMRLYWLLVLLREKISNGMRRITVSMPHRLLYRLCYALALLGKVPLIKYCTFSVHADWRVRLLENFDWLAPPFQYHHTKEEVLQWYAAAGFDIQGTLRHGFIPKVGVRGRKK